MTVKRLDLPPPRSHEDFEDLCLDLWKELLADPDAQKHGRSGQPQAGVDIFARRPDGAWVGISCKARSKTLAVRELDDLVEKARHFEPSLSGFVIATTAPRDVRLQRFAREMTDLQRKAGSFSVAVYSWDDIVDELFDYPEVLSKHYPTLRGLAAETRNGPGFPAGPWRLTNVLLTNVGPAKNFRLDLSPRINLLTGDNGLGKTLSLEVIWWILTGTWSDHQAFPGEESSLPRIGCRVAPSTDGDLFSDYDFQKISWTELGRKEPGAGLVVYLRAEGGISIWDPARFGLSQQDRKEALDDSRRAATHFSRKQLWEGLQNGETVVCNGLIRDWVSWQHQRHPLFDTLAQAVATLSPHFRQAIRPGPPMRISPRDAREVPTIELPYGKVPITHASAGMRRILTLSYALVWAWSEHQALSKLRKTPTASRMVLLIDELEAHLHPKWQRALLPALSAILAQLSTDLEVQTIASTHAPLVLASIEPSFDPDLDSITLLELENGGLEARHIPWAQQGDVIGWLTSDVFGLRQARSQEAERAIEAAEALMRGDSRDLPPELQTRDQIHRELSRVVPGHDPFWPRWIVTA